MIKEPQILLLMTASCGHGKEEAILQNLRREFQWKSVLIVSHRISTINNAHQILVLEEGMVTQRGTHEELVAHPGLYQELYHKQLLEEQIESVS